MAELKSPLASQHLQQLIDRENQKQAENDTDAGYGKLYWIYFPASGHWVEGTRRGFEDAIRKGLPVRRSRAMPRKAPEILREPPTQ